MARTATLYRMVLPDHVCPYGVRAKQMLTEHGFEVDDRLLQSREQVDTFMAERGLETTPLIEIDGETLGGSDELEAHLAQTSKRALSD